MPPLSSRNRRAPIVIPEPPQAVSGIYSSNVDQKNFLIPYRLDGRAARLARLMDRYANVPMDFADACLVDLAGQMNTGRIWTLDDDFRIYRWGRNRPFELLLDTV